MIFREDHQILLDAVIPKAGVQNWYYDFILASQPWRARTSAQYKAEKIVAPLDRPVALPIYALWPSGRLREISCRRRIGSPRRDVSCGFRKYRQKRPGPFHGLGIFVGALVWFFDIVIGRKRSAGGGALRFGWFWLQGFGHSDEGTLAVF